MKFFNWFTETIKPYQPVNLLDYNERSEFVVSIMNLIRLIDNFKANQQKKTWCLQEILSALRGPDFKTDINLKWLTTSRIRAIVCPMYYGDVNYVALTNIEINQRNAFLYGDSKSTHFASHYLSACATIKLLFGYDLLDERKLEEHEWKTLISNTVGSR
jgi:hypothetical protein